MGQFSRTMFLFLATMIAPALADEAPTDATAKERQTLESFGATNPTCLEWSDGCAVCARQDDKTFHCSLPGIACQPSVPVCRKPKPVEPAKP